MFSKTILIDALKAMLVVALFVFLLFSLPFVVEGMIKAFNSETGPIWSTSPNINQKKKSHKSLKNNNMQENYS